MLKCFADLKPFQAVEFSIMILLAVAIPFYWYAAQMCEIALVICGVLKVTCMQKIHFNEVQMRWKWAYLIFMATWVIYLIGMIYTQNTDEGWTQVSKKLGFLLFPLIFLISDMSYLTKERVKIIFYGLVAGCSIYFLMNFIAVTINIISTSQPFDLVRFKDYNLQVFYCVHHSYLSMYSTLAIAFLATENFTKNKKSVKIIDSTLAVLLMVFVVLLDSRAGILCLGISLIIILLWIFFVLKKKKLGLVITAAVLCCGVLMTVVSPGIFSRITETLENVKSEKTDRRIVQMCGYMPVVKENLLFGVGTGDRTDETSKSYRRYEESLINQIVPCDDVDNETFTEGRNALLNRIMEVSYAGNNWNEPVDAMYQLIENESNKHHCDKESVKKIAVEYIYISDAIELEIDTHNQYFETVLAVGIIGLLLMLAYFAIPIFVMFKNKSFDLVCAVFIVIIGFNALFESIFEGQVGIIFFNFFNVLIFNYLIVNKNLQFVHEK